MVPTSLVQIVRPQTWDKWLPEVSINISKWTLITKFSKHHQSLLESSYLAHPGPYPEVSTPGTGLSFSQLLFSLHSPVISATLVLFGLFAFWLLFLAPDYLSPLSSCLSSYGLAQFASHVHSGLFHMSLPLPGLSLTSAIKTATP